MLVVVLLITAMCGLHLIPVCYYGLDWQIDKLMPAFRHRHRQTFATNLRWISAKCHCLCIFSDIFWKWWGLKW